MGGADAAEHANQPAQQAQRDSLSASFRRASACARSSVASAFARLAGAPGEALIGYAGPSRGSRNGLRNAVPCRGGAERALTHG